MARLLFAALIAFLALGAGAAARSTDGPHRVTVRDGTSVPPYRRDARTWFHSIICPDGYTAVAGDTPRLHPDLVLVSSFPDLDDPEVWVFEFASYSNRTLGAQMVVQCVEGAESPGRFLLVTHSFTLRSNEVRQLPPQRPKSHYPLGPGFKFQSVRGGKLPRDSHPRVFGVRPGRRGFTFRIENRSEVPVRVRAGGVFVRPLSANRRVRSHVAIVSVTRTAKSKQRLRASVSCPRGFTAIAPFVDASVPELEADASVRRRGFSFSVFNASSSARRVRLLGSCLREESR